MAFSCNLRPSVEDQDLKARKGKGNRSFLVILFLIFVIFFMWSIQSSEAGIEEDLSSSVVYLRNKDQPVGTGFLVDSERFFYLVTAEHVARVIYEGSQAIIRTEGDKPAIHYLFELVGSPGGLGWVFHNEADLAILRLSPTSDILKKHLKQYSISISKIVVEKKAPERSIVLTVFGFPLGLGVQNFFSPISRETKAASGLLVCSRLDTHKPATFFFTQDPSIGGFSGAPIFDTGLPGKRGSSVFKIEYPPKIKLFGLVHGTVGDNTGGKMGMIVPSYYIVELIRSSESEK